MRNALPLAAALATALCACTDTGDICDSGTGAIGQICVPDPVAPSITTTIQMRELCGRGCSDLPSCTAVFRNAQVVLDVEQTVCNSQLTAACLSLGCLTRLVPCSLPSLPEGDYTLVVPGGPDQLLHVRSGGTSSCRLLDTDAGVQ
jgi:hypothetical protein